MNAIGWLLLGTALAAVIYILAIRFRLNRSQLHLRNWVIEEHPHAWEQLPRILRLRLLVVFGLQHLNRLNLIGEPEFRARLAECTMLERREVLSALLGLVCALGALLFGRAA